MVTQDAFKNEMSEENLVDAGLAAIFGWTDIEQTDFGAVVGKSPETLLHGEHTETFEEYRFIPHLAQTGGQGTQAEYPACLG